MWLTTTKYACAEAVTERRARRTSTFTPLSAILLQQQRQLLAGQESEEEGFPAFCWGRECAITPKSLAHKTAVVAQKNGLPPWQRCTSHTRSANVHFWKPFPETPLGVSPQPFLLSFDSTEVSCKHCCDMVALAGLPQNSLRHCARVVCRSRNPGWKLGVVDPSGPAPQHPGVDDSHATRPSGGCRLSCTRWWLTWCMLLEG